MKIKYEYVNSEVVEIEVDEKWAEILEELDKEEARNNHTETRRHTTLAVLGDEGAWLENNRYDPFDMIGRIINSAEETEIKKELCKAVYELSDKQQALVKAFYIDKITFTEYAKKMGVSQSAITQQHKTILKKLKKVLKKSL